MSVSPHCRTRDARVPGCTDTGSLPAASGLLDTVLSIGVWLSADRSPWGCTHLADWSPFTFPEPVVVLVSTVYFDYTQLLGLLWAGQR